MKNAIFCTARCRHFLDQPKTGESPHIGSPDIRSYRPYLVAVPSIRNPKTRRALIKWGLLVMITIGMKIT